MDWSGGVQLSCKHCADRQKVDKIYFLTIRTRLMIAKQYTSATMRYTQTSRPRRHRLTESYSGQTKKRSFLKKTPFEVPRIGLEPTRLSALAPETSASTISPSGHCDRKGNEKIANSNFASLFLSLFCHFYIALFLIFRI